jgi:1-acyl-sn-glycerol-3-phosphate acyltransferase
VLALFGISVELQFEGSPAQLDQGGVMVGLDQQSILDPTIGYAANDHRFLALWNIEYALIPFFGWVSWILGWVIVRQWPEQAKRQLGKAANHARSGGLVYLSAEGQRSKDGHLCPYKKGPAVLAIQSQALIHPVYIHGSRDCLPYGEWRIRPGRVVVRHLDPIPTAGLTYADRDQLLARLRALGEAEHRRWQEKNGSVD